MRTTHLWNFSVVTSLGKNTLCYKGSNNIKFEKLYSSLNGLESLNHHIPFTAKTVRLLCPVGTSCRVGPSLRENTGPSWSIPGKGRRGWERSCCLRLLAWLTKHPLTTHNLLKKSFIFTGRGRGNGRLICSQEYLVWTVGKNVRGWRQCCYGMDCQRRLWVLHLWTSSGWRWRSSWSFAGSDKWEMGLAGLCALGSFHNFMKNCFKKTYFCWYEWRTALISFNS